MPNVINGVNVTAMLQTIDAVKASPTVAQFRFKLKNDWVTGGHSRSILNGYRGADQEFERSQSFLLYADEPPVLLGHDQAPNPAEYLLTALAACVTTSLVYHAAARGIDIEEVESWVEGDIDLRGFLGIDPAVRNGFQNIRITLAIQAQVSDQQLQELAALGLAFSPVFDSVTNGVAISVQTERLKLDEVYNAA